MFYYDTTRDRIVIRKKDSSYIIDGDFSSFDKTHNVSCNTYHHRKISFQSKDFRSFNTLKYHLEEINNLGKRFFKNNFYMTPECFEKSTICLLENLIQNKCYFVVKIPETTVHLFPKNENDVKLRQLKMPVQGLYMAFKIVVKYHPINGFKTCFMRNIWGFQEYFDEDRSLLFPHLRTQSGWFCLGSSELAVLVDLLGEEDLMKTSSLDLLEIIFDYLPIYAGCESEEGGPYRSLQCLYVFPDRKLGSIYINRILGYYFFCHPNPKIEVSVEIIKIDETTYKKREELIISDIQGLLDDLEEFLPDYLKQDIRKYVHNHIVLKDIYNGDIFEIIKKSDFRFKDKHIVAKVKKYSKDLYYQESMEEINQYNSFLSKEFMDFFTLELNRILE